MSEPTLNRFQLLRNGAVLAAAIALPKPLKWLEPANSADSAATQTLILGEAAQQYRPQDLLFSDLTGEAVRVTSVYGSTITIERVGEAKPLGLDLSSGIRDQLDREYAIKKEQRRVAKEQYEAWIERDERQKERNRASYIRMLEERRRLR
jgi:hypothetical protein